MPPLAEASPDAKILVITNLVDVMTYHAIKLSGFGPNRVFGTGTLIGSARNIPLGGKGRDAGDAGIHPQLRGE